MNEYLTGPSAEHLDRNLGTAIMASSPSEAAHKAFAIRVVDHYAPCVIVRANGEDTKFHNIALLSDPEPCLL